MDLRGRFGPRGARRSRITRARARRLPPRRDHGTRPSHEKGAGVALRCDRCGDPRDGRGPAARITPSARARRPDPGRGGVDRQSPRGESRCPAGGCSRRLAGGCQRIPPLRHAIAARIPPAEDRARPAGFGAECRWMGCDPGGWNTAGRLGGCPGSRGQAPTRHVHRFARAPTGGRGRKGRDDVRCRPGRGRASIPVAPRTRRRWSDR